MSLPAKILLINTGLLAAVTLVVAYATDSFPGNGFFLMLAVIASAAAAGAIGLGFLLLFRKDKRPARGFFLSFALFALLGAVAYFLLSRY